MLELAEPATAAVLDLLDGTRTGAAIVAECAGRGISADQVRCLIDALGQAGMVVDAHALLPAHLPEPARRRLTAEATALALASGPAGPPPARLLRARAAARVHFVGDGPLVPAIAGALVSAGVGCVATGPGGPAPGTTGTTAVTTRDSTPSPGPMTGVPRRRAAAPTFEVRVGPDRAPTTLVARSYARRALPHLGVLIRDATVVVGPMVRGTGSPCLYCLDLHRTDRDPDWPALAAQLATSPGAAACATTTLLAATAYAAAEVLAHLDGQEPTTVGATVEISGPGRHRRRSWHPHPDCDCGRRRQQGPQQPQLTR